MNKQEKYTQHDIEEIDFLFASRFYENDRLAIIEILEKNGYRKCSQELVLDEVIEECAKIAEHQKTLCGYSMSRKSTCDDIAYNIRNNAKIIINNFGTNVGGEK